MERNEGKNTDDDDEEGPSVKKPRLMNSEKGKGAYLSGSDEEFCLDSDSDVEEEDEESSDELSSIPDDESGEGEVLVVTTSSISLISQDSEFCLLQTNDPKELKLVIPEEDVKKAEEHASGCFEKGLIPILEIEGTEVAQTLSTGLVYCDCLKPVPNDFKFTHSYNGNDEEVKGVPVQDNKLFVVKLKDSENYFAASSLRM